VLLLLLLLRHSSPLIAGAPRFPPGFGAVTWEPRRYVGAGQITRDHNNGLPKRLHSSRYFGEKYPTMAPDVVYKYPPSDAR
jgi:hypothetical protein